MKARSPRVATRATKPTVGRDVAGTRAAQAQHEARRRQLDVMDAHRVIGRRHHDRVDGRCAGVVVGSGPVPHRPPGRRHCREIDHLVRVVLARRTVQGVGDRGLRQVPFSGLRPAQRVAGGVHDVDLGSHRFDVARTIDREELQRRIADRNQRTVERRRERPSRARPRPTGNRSAPGCRRADRPALGSTSRAPDRIRLARRIAGTLYRYTRRPGALRGTRMEIFPPRRPSARVRVKPHALMDREKLASSRHADRCPAAGKAGSRAWKRHRVRGSSSSVLRFVLVPLDTLNRQFMCLKQHLLRSKSAT